MSALDDFDPDEEKLKEMERKFEATGSEAGTTPGEHKTLRKLAPLPPSTELEDELDKILTDFQFHTEQAGSNQAKLDLVFDSFMPAFQELITKHTLEGIRVCARNRGEWGYLDEDEFEEEAIKALSQEGK